MKTDVSVSLVKKSSLKRQVSSPLAEGKVTSIRYTPEGTDRIYLETCKTLITSCAGALIHSLTPFKSLELFQSTALRARGPERKQRSTGRGAELLTNKFRLLSGHLLQTPTKRFKPHRVLHCCREFVRKRKISQLRPIVSSLVGGLVQ